MKRIVFIFFFVLILSISLSNAIKTITVNETDLVSLKPKARDEDADMLFYSFTEPLNEEGKWQTDFEDAGEYEITITVSDGELSTSQDVLLVVKKKNVGPTIDSFSPEGDEVKIDEGKGIEFSVKASDLNKDILSYMWKFDGAVVSEEENYRYDADYSDAGQYRIKVIVSDSEKEVEKEWDVNVDNVDRKALLDEIGEVTVNEGEVLSLVLPDFESYNLDYTISEPIGNDNYWETTYKDAGWYEVELSIEDGNFSASKKIKVGVSDIDRAPVFKPIANARMGENQKITIELEAYDPDDEKVEFSGNNMPSGATVEGNKFEWMPDFDTIKKENVVEKTLDKFHLLYKTFNVDFIAKSRGLEVKQSVAIRVRDVNRAPVLDDMATITVNEGEEVVIEPKATDPDGDDVSYSYSGWIDIDRYFTTYDEGGTYKVKVIASDGFLTDEKFVTIEVNDVNREPVFNKISPIEVNEGEKIELELFLSDPDGDSVNISSESLPGNSTMEDGVFTWTPDYNTVEADVRLFMIDFVASDGEEETVKQANVTVYNVNRAPKITAASQRDVTVKNGGKVQFEVVAEDGDGDDLSYVWKFSLLEQYTSGSAMIRKFTSVGNKKVKVIVSDGKDEAEYVFNVKVV